MTLNRELTNRLVFRIASDRYAESRTSHIYLRFGIPSWLPGGGGMWNLRINGDYNRSGVVHTVDFNNVRPESFFDTIPTDHWDHVRLETPSYDGLGIASIRLIHSSEEILNLNFSPLHWLDRPYGKIIDLTHDILSHKRAIVGNTRYPVIAYAAEELGKTDGYKYGTGRLWCSEFAAWCLKKSVEWDDVPIGNIDSNDLVDYFRAKRRLASETDVINGEYTLLEGDYLQLNGAEHSGLFYQYINRRGGSRIDPPASPNGNTWIRCVEGNVSRLDTGVGVVRVVDRQLRTIDNVGKTH